MADNRPLLIRSFDIDTAPLAFREDADDGLTVEGLCVPYGAEANVVDLTPTGELVQYRESFAPGSFARAMRSPRHVLLTYGHSESLAERLGFGASFTETPAGLMGTFRLDASTAAKARDCLESSHGALSVGFHSVNPRHGGERDGDTVVRRSVILRHVAAVPVGAYPQALVASVRHAPTDDDVTPADVEAAEDHQTTLDLLAFVELASAGQASWEEKARALTPEG